MSNQYTANPLDPIVRFWSKINKNGSVPSHCPQLGHCWEWQTGKNKRGYGYFAHNSRHYYSHRYAWIISFGEIPDNLQVLHKCDNPSCCNPNHLFLGTIADNMKDRARKGRYEDRRGHLSSFHKLNIEDVVSIRKKYATGFVTQRSLAYEFNVSDGAICNIILRKTWQNIP